jgi:hypothetical protein
MSGNLFDNITNIAKKFDNVVTKISYQLKKVGKRLAILHVNRGG